MAYDPTAAMQSTDLTKAQKEFVQRTVMFHLEPLKNDPFFKYAEKVNFRPDSDTYSWRLYGRLPKTTASLQEGVLPAELKYSLVDFKVKAKMEGAWLSISDVALKYGIDDQLAIAADLLGENALIRMKTILADTVKGGTNVKAATGTTISIADLTAIKAQFVRYGVNPVEGGKYIFVASPEVIADLKSQTDVNNSWIDVMKYTNVNDIIDGEVGALMGFRFVESNYIELAASTTGATGNIYPCIVFGKGAFGTVAIDGESASGGFETIYKPLSEAGGPLNQKATLAWKHMGFCARILRDEALLRYEVGSTITTQAEMVDSERTHYNAE